MQRAQDNQTHTHTQARLLTGLPAKLLSGKRLGYNHDGINNLHRML